MPTPEPVNVARGMGVLWSTPKGSTPPLRGGPSLPRQSLCAMGGSAEQNEEKVPEAAVLTWLPQRHVPHPTCVSIVTAPLPSPMNAASSRNPSVPARLPHPGEAGAHQYSFRGVTDLTLYAACAEDFKVPAEGSARSRTPV